MEKVDFVLFVCIICLLRSLDLCWGVLLIGQENLDLRTGKVPELYHRAVSLIA